MGATVSCGKTWTIRRGSRSGGAQLRRDMDPLLFVCKPVPSPAAPALAGPEPLALSPGAGLRAQQPSETRDAIDLLAGTHC